MIRLAVSDEVVVLVVPGRAPVNTITFSPTVSLAAVEVAPLFSTTVALVILYVVVPLVVLTEMDVALTAETVPLAGAPAPPPSPCPPPAPPGPPWAPLAADVAALRAARRPASF